MKTAMQELIERLEEKQSMWDKKSKEHIDIANTYYVAIIMAKKLLEKEERLMFHCFNYAADRTCDKEFNEYLNKYYKNEQ